VTPEKVALNWCYSPGRPDNRGKTFEKGEPLSKGAPTAYFSNFDGEGLTHFLKAKGMACELSFSAGTYVCNATYFKVLEILEKQKSKAQACFIHIPKDVNPDQLADYLIEFILE
jgi:pyroglutamyl-peptidase